MRHSIRHREPDLSCPAHIGQRGGDVAAVAHQLRGIVHPVGTIEKVVDPMRCVRQIRLGLHFITSILRHDSEDEGVPLDIAVVVDLAGDLAVLLQETGRGQCRDKFRFPRAHRGEELAPPRNASIQCLAPRADCAIRSVVAARFVSLNVHCSLLPSHHEWDSMSGTIRSLLIIGAELWRFPTNARSHRCAPRRSIGTRPALLLRTRARVSAPRSPLRDQSAAADAGRRWRGTGSRIRRRCSVRAPHLPTAAAGPRFRGRHWFPPTAIEPGRKPGRSRAEDGGW